MAYRASLGGIDGSGVRMPNTQPIIDIGSVIDSASRAFANNREGVLHRALLQQAANREDEAQKLRVAEAAKNGIMSVDAARKLVADGGFADESPAPAQAPAAPAEQGATTVSPTNPEGAAGLLQPPVAPTRKPKYSMVDLGNGYAQIPELTPGYGQDQMLDKRLAAMAAQIHERGQESRDTEGTRQTGRIALAGDKNGYTLQQIAARGVTQANTARIRASLAADPATMKPLQRASLYEKLAKNYVGGADGDANEAYQAAKTDPHLKDFGVSADELSGYIGSAAMAIQDARNKGDVATASKLLTSYLQTEPDKAVSEARDIRGAAKKGGAPAKETITSAEAKQLKALGHTDADIATHYTVK